MAASVITQFWGHNLSCKPKLQKVLKAKEGNVWFVGKYTPLYFTGGFYRRDFIIHCRVCSQYSLWWEDPFLSSMGVEWHRVKWGGRG